MLKVYNFTEPELQYFRDNCNFTDEELECLNLRAKDKTNEWIAQKMHISPAKVSLLVNRIKKKIMRIL